MRQILGCRNFGLLAQLEGVLHKDQIILRGRPAVDMSEWPELGIGNAPQMAEPGRSRGVNN